MLAFVANVLVPVVAAVVMFHLTNIVSILVHNATVVVKPGISFEYHVSFDSTVK